MSDLKEPLVAEEKGTEWKGIGTVVGGMMFHMAGGTQYCLGNLVVYMPAGIKYFEKGGKGPADALLCLPVTLIAMMLTMPVGPILEKKLGPRNVGMIGGFLMGFGVFISSYCTTLAPFMFCYAFIYGCGVGTGYQMPLLTGTRWFPSKRGLIVGCVVGSFGSAAFFFNLIDSNIVNPEELNAVAGAYPPEIYERWPSLLRKLGVVYAILGMGGSFLFNNPPSFEYPVATAASKSVKDDVLSKRFLMMWLMIITSATSGMFLVGAYKAYGVQQPALNNDEFLTLVGSVSSLMGNAGGRLFWGSLSDVYGFKRPFIALTVAQGFFMITFKFFAMSKFTFSLATTVILFCMGGNYAMFPAQTLRKFGANGGLVYGVMFSAFTVGALVGPIFTKAVLSFGGYPLIFGCFGTLSLVSTALTTQLPD